MSFGCNVGLNVITNPTNQFPLPNVELFNGSTIHIVQWSQDPQCGIYQNMYNFTGQLCYANRKFGNVIEFNEATDINCNVPIDTWVIVLLLVVGLYSWFKIKTNYGTNKNSQEKEL